MGSGGLLIQINEPFRVIKALGRLKRRWIILTIPALISHKRGAS